MICMSKLLEGILGSWRDSISGRFGLRLEFYGQRHRSSSPLTDIGISESIVDISRLLTSRGSPSPPSNSRSPSERTTAASTSHDGSGQDQFKVSPPGESLSRATTSPNLQRPQETLYGDLAQPTVATAFQQYSLPPSAAVGMSEPMSMYPQPQPQVQKRGPPATSHPFENPAKKQSKWSTEENALITQLRGNGMKWEDISKRLPGRSAISCRLHYQNFLERKAEWDEEKKSKLARLYDRFKKEMWDPVAKELGMPWRAVEAMHWELGNDGIAARTGVPVFATASATATEPPLMSNAFVTATSGPPLGSMLSYSPSSPPKPIVDQLHPYHGQQLVPIPVAPQQAPTHSSYPPPPAVPQEPPSSRQRRSVSTAPSSRRARSTSRKRALSGTSMESKSPRRAPAMPVSSHSVPPILLPADRAQPHFPPQQMSEGERLPPMRYLTEPSTHGQQFSPVSYAMPPEPRTAPPRNWLETESRIPATRSEAYPQSSGVGSGENSYQGGGGGGGSGERS